MFIDFNDGMDGIVRNAAVVQAAINAVNNAKQFDNRSGRREQNVVMGIGTGGLNARYALANMTQNFAGTPTETRLLITHDAPHRGANIALGLQHLIRMLGNFSYFGTTSADIFPDFAETVAFFNAPINVETLLYRANTDVTNVPNTFLNTTYRSMVDFAPGTQPYQFVPTSLGNECARPLFAAGRHFMDFGQGVGFGIKVKLAVFAITIPVDIPVMETKFDCVVFASSIPNENVPNRKVAALQTTFKFLLFGFIEVVKNGYDGTAFAPTTYQPVDGAPGSFNTILDFSELRNYANAIGNWEFKAEQYLFPIPLYKGLKLKFYGFVKAYAYNSGTFTTQYTALPVGSALDVDPFSTSTFTQKFVNGVNAAFPSKGNTFIAQESNTSISLFNNVSMRFTARNAQFMYNEMENFPNLLNCSAECSNPYYINGLAFVCTNGTYYVPGLQRGVSITWEVLPTNLATISGTGNLITLTRTGTANGVLTLKANLGAGCSAAHPVSTQVVIGTGIFDPLFEQKTIVCPPGNQYSIAARVTETPGATSYSWYIDGVLKITSSTNAATVPGGLANGSMHTLQARIQTPCGQIVTALPEGRYRATCGGGGGGSLSVVASPNPTTGSINLSFEDTGDSTSSFISSPESLTQVSSLNSIGKTIISLFEFNSGSLRKQWIMNEINSKTYYFNVAGLRKGLYVLQVDRDNKTATTKIILE